MTSAPPRARRPRGPLCAVLAAVAVLATLLLAGCGGGSTDATADPKAFTAVIDVRTPAEFAEEHVEGAVNLDVQAADFATKVAALDPAGTYLVYCRSGNRSAAAAATMTSAGLRVTDGGGLTDMKDAGYPFVEG
jgi:phage shock protein E